MIDVSDDESSVSDSESDDESVSPLVFEKKEEKMENLEDNIISLPAASEPEGELEEEIIEFHGGTPEDKEEEEVSGESRNFFGTIIFLNVSVPPGYPRK